MSRFLPYLLLIAMGWTIASPALAAAIPQQQVQVAAGTDGTTVNGSIKGDDIIDYVLTARAGETLVISLTTDNPDNYFNILAPGQTDIAFFTGAFEGNDYVGQVSESGDYKIRVYLTSEAVKRGASANYRLSVRVSGAGGAGVAQSGPDFWRIGANPTDLHRDPSAGSPVTHTVAAGTVLRNLGCTTQDGVRWCRVQSPDDIAIEGWAHSRSLIASRQTTTDGKTGEPSTRTQKVRFPSGSKNTLLKSDLGGGEAVNYVVSAGNGQYLSVTLNTKATTTHFNIFLPGGDLLYESADSSTGNQYQGQLNIDGDYTIAVYSTASRDAQSGFALDIGLD